MSRRAAGSRPTLRRIRVQIVRAVLGYSTYPHATGPLATFGEISEQGLSVPNCSAVTTFPEISEAIAPHFSLLKRSHSRPRARSAELRFLRRRLDLRCSA